MLQAVDDESGGDEDTEHFKKRNKNRATAVSDENRASIASLDPGSSGSNASESDDNPIKPRGRVAARLQGQDPTNGAITGQDRSTEEQGHGNSYERVRKQLQLQEQRQRRQESPKVGNGYIVNGEDIELSTPPKRQRLQSRLLSSKTPSPVTIPSEESKKSPGLFPTPEAPSSQRLSQGLTSDSGSDSDHVDPQANQRVQELLARKKAERKARQAVEAEKAAAKEARLREHSPNALGVSEDESDEENAARRLTQQARPTRKASRKALEEMSRETQRMHRNMQLAHQAKTKKKITKESLFERFNFRTSKPPTAEAQQPLSSSTAASSVPVSDAENGQAQQTPPTSPPKPSDEVQKLVVAEVTPYVANESPMLEQHSDPDNELPSLEDAIKDPMTISGKGNGKAIDNSPSDFEAENSIAQPEIRPIKISLPKHQNRSKKQDKDSDSDLEILPRQSSKAGLEAFNRLPSKKDSEARSLLTLRALAHLHSPERQKGKARASMTSWEMQRSLQQRARQQAAAERAEKIQDLIKRGVIVQSAEERRKDQIEVEDLVERARQQAEEIKMKEKEAARKEKRAKGEHDTVADSSDEDEDYEDNDGNEPGVGLSGSEEELIADDDVSGSDEEEAEPEDDEDDSLDVEDDTRNANGFIQDEASEDSDETEDKGPDNDAEMADDESVEVEEINPLKNRRKSRAHRVIEDDDEDKEEDDKQPLCTPQASHEFLKIPAIPALAMSGVPALPMMGMTQAFAATMADIQSQEPNRMYNDQEQESLRFLGSVPEPDLPIFDPYDTESMVMDSQAGKDSMNQNSMANKDINLHYSQSQIQYDSLQDTQNMPLATQDDDIPDPTQDVGFGLSSPAANRFVSAPPSTVDTVLLADADSPVKKRKGRLHRGRIVAANDEPPQAQGPVEPEISANAST